MLMVIWRTILDFPNYEVSNNGDVRNKRTKKQLSPWNNGKGYLTVDLNGHTLRVHRLVAKAFLDDTYEDGMEVNHIHGIKNKNFVGDLEWTSHLENMRHAHQTGLIPHDGQGGLPKKRIKILETGMVFESIRSCARWIKGDHIHISECLRGLRKSHKGFHFEYFKEV